MPAHSTDAASDVNAAEIIPSTIACPHTIIPQVDGHAMTTLDCDRGVATMPPASNNTAGDMSLAQEESMYAHEQPSSAQEDAHKEKMDPSQMMEDGDVEVSVRCDHVDVESRAHEPQVEQSAWTSKRMSPSELINTQLRTPSPTIPSSSPRIKRPSAVPTCDHELNRTSEAGLWDFTRKRTSTAIPSSLFHPFAKYSGTQQSDRQIYNVAVTILTVDVEQSTLSGYLEICGLTPDHPKLTTFFTGEIIGGPDQRYSFRTKDPSWGASNKTDMTHWARFPAWRPLSPFAKTDIEFVHPVDGGDWWQQEHVFMRWKEHFLVPDYKLRSIQGASFEGFYYICLNQIQGTISGIYFHSKSEK